MLVDTPARLSGPACDTSVDAQLGRAARRGVRRPAAQQADLEPVALRPDDAPRRRGSRTPSLRRRPRRIDDRAVGQHAVDVEQQQPEAARAGVDSMASGQSGISSDHLRAPEVVQVDDALDDLRRRRRPRRDVILRSSISRSASTASIGRPIVTGCVVMTSPARRSSRFEPGVMCRRRSPSVTMPAQPAVVVDDARHARGACCDIS